MGAGCWTGYIYGILFLISHATFLCDFRAEFRPCLLDWRGSARAQLDSNITKDLSSSSKREKDGARQKIPEKEKTQINNGKWPK